MLALAGPTAAQWGMHGLLYAAMAGWAARGLVLMIATVLVREADG